MKSEELFKKSFTQAQDMLRLHDVLSGFRRQRTRSEWRKKFYKNKITSWSQSDGIDRYVASGMVLLGTDVGLSTFANARTAFHDITLRSALVLGVSALDKLMHEIVLKKFSQLVKSGRLNGLTKISVKDAYAVALSARVRKGKGGKKKKRPAYDLKEAILDALYREALVGPDKIKLILNGLGVEDLWGQWGSSQSPQIDGRRARAQWEAVYQRRNYIAHEADMLRSVKMRTAKYHPISRSSIAADLDTISCLAAFLISKVS